MARAAVPDDIADAIFFSRPRDDADDGSSDRCRMAAGRCDFRARSASKGFSKPMLAAADSEENCQHLASWEDSVYHRWVRGVSIIAGLLVSIETESVSGSAMVNCFDKRRSTQGHDSLTPHVVVQAGHALKRSSHPALRKLSVPGNSRKLSSSPVKSPSYYLKQLAQGNDMPGARRDLEWSIKWMSISG